MAEQNERTETSFNYTRLKDGSIEINIHGDTRKALEAIAEASYEAARPVGMGFLQPYNTPSDKIDFSEFINLDDSTRILSMDYVNGRQCKTFISKRVDKYILSSWAFERDRGNVESILESAKLLLSKTHVEETLENILEYGEEYNQPTKDGTLPMNIAREKLRNIGKIIPEMDINIQDFARLLANYLSNDKLLPEGVIMSIQYLKVDLEKGVCDWGENRGKQIESNLVGQPALTYNLMEMNLIKSIDKIFPKWFSGRINDFYQKVIEEAKKRAKFLSNFPEN